MRKMNGSKDFWVMVSNVYTVENGAVGGGGVMIHTSPGIVLLKS